MLSAGRKYQRVVTKGRRFSQEALDQGFVGCITLWVGCIVQP